MKRKNTLNSKLICSWDGMEVGPLYHITDNTGVSFTHQFPSETQVWSLHEQHVVPEFSPPRSFQFSRFSHLVLFLSCTKVSSKEMFVSQKMSICFLINSACRTLRGTASKGAAGGMDSELTMYKQRHSTSAKSPTWWRPILSRKLQDENSIFCKGQVHIREKKGANGRRTFHEWPKLPTGRVL